MIVARVWFRRFFVSFEHNAQLICMSFAHTAQGRLNHLFLGCWFFPAGQLFLLDIIYRPMETCLVRLSRKVNKRHILFCMAIGVWTAKTKASLPRMAINFFAFATHGTHLTNKKKQINYYHQRTATAAALTKSMTTTKIDCQPLLIQVSCVRDRAMLLRAPFIPVVVQRDTMRARYAACGPGKSRNHREGQGKRVVEMRRRRRRRRANIYGRE